MIVSQCRDGRGPADTGMSLNERTPESNNVGYEKGVMYPLSLRDGKKMAEQELTLKRDYKPA